MNSYLHPSLHWGRITWPRHQRREARDQLRSPQGDRRVRPPHREDRKGREHRQSHILFRRIKVTPCTELLSIGPHVIHVSRVNLLLV